MVTYTALSVCLLPWTNCCLNQFSNLVLNCLDYQTQYTHCNLAFLAKRGNFKFLCVARDVSLQTVHQGYNSLYKQLVQSSIHCFVLILLCPCEYLHIHQLVLTAANRKIT